MQEKTSRFLYSLTMEPRFWKRLLKTLPTKLQPQPTAGRFNLKHLSNLEIESLLVRSLSLERLWTKHSPNAFCIFTRGFDLGMEIMNMTMVPGGRYLLASVQMQKKYYVLVCGLDTMKGVLTLARTPAMDSKAFHVQAKYVTVGGKKGLLISYKRRVYRHESDRVACRRYVIVRLGTV